MKEHSKDSYSFIFSLIKPLPKLAFSLLFFLSIFLTLYSLILFYKSPTSSSNNHHPHLSIRTAIGLGPGPGPVPAQHEPDPDTGPTELRHVAFGIGAAAKHWPHRKHYVKYWWPGPNVTRGFVFLDQPVDVTRPDNPSDYPTLLVSEDTGGFPYSHRQGSRSALRITRIVSEMVRIIRSDNTNNNNNNNNNIRWYVMGDDDTVFFTDNLVKVLRKYDHNKTYYIGSNSETHVQNVNFAHDMAFGGGGFAISYPLARAIEKMHDGCIRRYGSLFGSDDRIHACLAELGVPLTKEPGFHQCDLYGNLFGLLAAHPIAPLVTLHHLDLLDPIFPYMNRTQALDRLRAPAQLDSAGLMQQSICYDPVRNWTVSVSWGYAVQIIRGSVTPRDMQRPARTFVDWYYKDDPSRFSFNTRAFDKHPCQKPYVYYVNNTRVDSKGKDVILTEYALHHVPHSYCWWKTNANPENVRRVEVYKKPNPHKWDEVWPNLRSLCFLLLHWYLSVYRAVRLNDSAVLFGEILRFLPVLVFSIVTLGKGSQVEVVSFGICVIWVVSFGMVIGTVASYARAGYESR
ncbi:hypothetical protein RND81_01G194000 [Saponaria officinalis]|uniref:Uncharacterized protein n=1 Tax=Saponaria officinalis TaxID=3572 RepID=A0AAW1N8N6_SAPOF